MLVDIQVADGGFDRHSDVSFSGALRRGHCIVGGGLEVPTLISEEILTLAFRGHVKRRRVQIKRKGYQ
jgi:hypothetical protein